MPTQRPAHCLFLDGMRVLYVIAQGNWKGHKSCSTPRQAATLRQDHQTYLYVVPRSSSCLSWRLLAAPPFCLRTLEGVPRGEAIQHLLLKVKSATHFLYTENSNWYHMVFCQPARRTRVCSSNSDASLTSAFAAYMSDRTFPCIQIGISLKVNQRMSCIPSRLSHHYPWDETWSISLSQTRA